MSIHDARTQYTKQIIRQQFLALLRIKPLAKITVKELCENCGINRATFYRHYLDIYDLMEGLERELLDQQVELLNEGDYSDLRSFFIKLLHLLQHNDAKWLVLGSENGDSTLFARMFMISYEYAYPKLCSKLPDQTEPEKEMLYHFLALGSGGVLNYWIKNGMRESVEEVADFLSYGTVLRTSL